ncbi:septum formation protein Maf [Candidatus Woesearchaeota archaeon]|nr:MAG: septum formation protein [archaeon GW2011_AR4]MBS3129689.1 septum formation protein Maf [Candidatus Woesearchaeota archaeon]HIH38793.1 septum formation protein Maf [Candidatus Woesearchaeota archaeon]HIH49208.1 septum formation protein Maf [Candidatus Woesearchaeota archaeon]HIJ03351.1 septum formation protein Maf [Candidatus Woesearchaeota archaeon]
MAVILASQSPRRKELLQAMGIPFRAVPSDAKEDLSDTKDPVSLVIKNALAKARFVAKTEKGIILGFDTIGFLDGKVLGKPKDQNDAKAMLKSMSGKTHQVYSGIAIIDTEKDKEITDVEKTDVAFRELSEEEIDHYLKHNNVLDKAASYGIQDGAGFLIKEIHGCYTNIMGLPVEKVTKMFKKI